MNQRHPRRIQLCVAIVHYRTKLKIPRRGVATTYLAGLQSGDKLQVRIKKGLIVLPEDKDTPVICVGPGTGIAPMRAVIEERTLQGSYGENSQILVTYLVKSSTHVHVVGRHQKTHSTKVAAPPQKTSTTPRTSLLSLRENS